MQFLIRVVKGCGKRGRGLLIVAYFEHLPIFNQVKGYQDRYTIVGHGYICGLNFYYFKGVKG